MAANYTWKLINTVQGTHICERDPIGWDELSLTLNRSEKYIGIFHEFSQQVTFTNSGGGAEFIQDCFENDRYWETDIEVQVFDGSDLILRGKLDMPNARKVRDGWSVTIEQFGLNAKFFSREAISVDIHSDLSIGGITVNNGTYSGYALNMHSVVIPLASEVDGSGNSYNTGILGGFDIPVGQLWNTFHSVPMDLIENELQTTNETVYQNNLLGGTYVFQDVDDQVLDLSFHDANFVRFVGYPASYIITYDFDGQIDILNNNLGITNYQASLSIRQGPNLAQSTVVQTVWSTGGILVSGLATIPLAVSGSGFFSTTVNQNDQFFLVMFIQLLPTTGTSVANYDIDFDWTTANIQLNSNTSKPATMANAWAIHEAINKVCGLIIDQDTAIYSEYFGRTNSSPVAYASNGCGSFTAITNGYQIRGESINDNRPTISISELFDSLNAIWCIGVGIDTLSNGEQVLRWEDRNHFFDDTVIILTIPDLPLDIEYSIIPDLYFNQVLIGYEKYGIQDINGLQDIHGFREYVMDGISKLENALGLESKLIGSMFCIEITRRQSITEFPTTDTAFDSENFIVCLRRDITLLDEAEKDENIVGTTNLLQPSSAYNLRITPTRNFLRWYPVTSAALVAFGGEYKYLNGEINDQYTSIMSTNCPGDVQNRQIAENASIKLNANFGDRSKIGIFQATFSYPLTSTQWAIIKANPTGKIQLQNIGAYIKTVEWNPTKKIANFTVWLQAL